MRIDFIKPIVIIIIIMVTLYIKVNKPLIMTFVSINS